MKNKRDIILLTLFVAYSLMLIYFLFFNGRSNMYGFTLGEYIKHRANIIPFRYIKWYISNLLKGERLYEIAINLVGNIAIFIPLGALLPAVIRKMKPFGNFLLLSIILPFVIETVQLITMVGCFDIDDIMLNTLGLVIGWVIYKIIALVAKRKSVETD